MAAACELFRRYVAVLEVAIERYYEEPVFSAPFIRS